MVHPVLRLWIVSVVEPMRGRYSGHLGRQIYLGLDETKDMLADIQTMLSDVIFSGGNAALHVVGATYSGKSLCLFGPREHTIPTGVVASFAQSYYRRCSINNELPLIEISVFQVYNEQVLIHQLSLDQCGLDVPGVGSPAAPGKWGSSLFQSSCGTHIMQTHPTYRD